MSAHQTQQQIQEWWQQQFAGQATPNTKAKRYSPDHTAYHTPDPRQDGRMPVGVGGMMGAIIPEGREDGGSKGFDAARAGVVVLGEGAGGAAVDMSQLTNDKILAAMQQSKDIEEVYYHLANAHVQAPPKVAHTTEAAAVRVNPVMPGQYVVPKANTDGAQEVPVNQYVPPAAHAQPGAYPTEQQIAEDVRQVHPTQMLPQPSEPQGRPQPQQQPNAPQPMPMPAAPAVQLPQPVPQPQPPQPQPQPGVTPAPSPQQMGFDPNQMMAMMQQMLQQHQPAPQPQYVPPQHTQTSQVPEQASPPQPQAPKQAGGVLPGIETLDIPFASGPLPEKPRTQVMWDLGELGQMSTFYHAVLDGNGCVILVYDTRYEEGQQFVPPNRGLETIELHLPKTQRSFTICSMGLSNRLGVFDLIILVKREEEEPQDTFMQGPPQGGYMGQGQQP
jgi:hypothetical protein